MEQRPAKQFHVPAETTLGVIRMQVTFRRWGGPAPNYIAVDYSFRNLRLKTV